MAAAFEIEYGLMHSSGDEAFALEDSEVLADAGGGELEVGAEIAHGAFALFAQVVQDLLSRGLHTPPVSSR